jgi:SNF2 family DNA or RNA helicase
LLGNPIKLGVGQNIQFTNYQIFLNNSFSYFRREQAISRQDRKGQTQKVSVFDVLAKKSIDLQILKCLDNKKDLDITLSKFSRLIIE